jgi:dienelactone hydrolase
MKRMTGSGTILGVALALTIALASAAGAKMVHQTIQYKQGDTPLEGYLAYDDSVQGKRAGVVVVHDWAGLGDYVMKRADMLAELGYVALAIDIYGAGVRPTTMEDRSKQAGIYRADRALMRARAEAGFEQLRSQAMVDPARIAAIGYCFGGGVALEMARAGLPLAGVVSFHGSLDTPNAADARNIKGKILVLHGADDPYVPAEAVAACEKEMRDAGVDWQLTLYGGAVHSFTRWDAGNDNASGAAYNEKADKRSWTAMRAFFDEVLK